MAGERRRGLAIGQCSWGRQREATEAIALLLVGGWERPGSQGTDSKIGKAGTHKGGCRVLDANLGTTQGWRDSRAEASPCFSAVRFLSLPTMLHSQPRCCGEKLCVSTSPSWAQDAGNMCPQVQAEWRHRVVMICPDCPENRTQGGVLGQGA